VDGTAEQAVAPSFLARHAFTADAQDVEELRYSLQRAAGGKGVTAAQARTGALCEALERYSGVFDGTETVVRARMTDLGDQAIHPNASMLFSDRQLNEARAVRTAANPGRRTVVLPPAARPVPAWFDPDAEIDWTPIWSLTHARVRYLPTAYCYYGAGSLPGAAFAMASPYGGTTGLRARVSTLAYGTIQRLSACSIGSRTSDAKHGPSTSQPISGSRPSPRCPAAPPRGGRRSFSVSAPISTPMSRFAAPSRNSCSHCPLSVEANLAPPRRRIPCPPRSTGSRRRRSKITPIWRPTRPPQR
jgi:hypothetical protein